MTEDNRTEIEKLNDQQVALIAKLDEYIKFLDESSKAPVCNAYIHGWRCPQKDIEKGEGLREEISKLRAIL